MKKLIVFLLPALLLMASCQNDGGDLGQEASVTEVLDREARIPAKKTQTTREEIQTQAPKDSINVGAFEFDNMTHEFGTIDEGESVKHSFKFKNTGKAPLVITDARGSCGCTVPQWPKEPIPAGGEGSIDIVFNSKGKKGAQNKTVTITANTWPNPRTVLNVKGEVTPDPNKPKPSAKKGNQ